MTRDWQWVVRELGRVRIFLGKKEPWYDTVYGSYTNRSGVVHVGQGDFKRIFGFLPPANKPVKVKFKADMEDV